MIKNNLKRQNKKDLIFFNKALEYFEKYSEDSFKVNCEITFNHEDQLREEMLAELNNLKEIIANNPDRKLNSLQEAEKQLFYDFVRFYSVCPICGSFNHYYHLKRFYFDDSKNILRNHLIKLMENDESKKHNKYNLQIGIPCCKCYKINFE